MADTTFFVRGLSMGMPYHSNWACSRIRKKLREENPTAEEIAELLASHPKFLATIQQVIDERNEPDYDPDMPGNDSAEHVIQGLSDALVWYEGKEFEEA
ncbi:MAG: hypothetical protein H0T51_00880 [Pirellulales bacterium]|nr:hypothetical protein [Pirellulales bacterium]